MRIFPTMTTFCAINGEIVLPATGVPDMAASVLVQIEDISRADASSISIAEQRQYRVILRAGAVLPFTVQVPADQLNPRNLYSVRVHIDVTGSGEVEVGDLVTTQTFPVLTRGYPQTVSIPVHCV